MLVSFDIMDLHVFQGLISDFTPSDSPMIPSLVVSQSEEFVVIPIIIQMKIQILQGYLQWFVLIYKL